MRSWISALSAVSLLVLPDAAASQPAPLDASAYGAVPAIDFVQLSPSGERLAYVTVVGTARRLLVVDLSGKTVLSEPVGETKVRDIVWAGDDRLLVTASETQGLDLSSYRYEFSHTVAINLATSKLTVIFATRPDIFSAVFGYYGAVQDGGRWYGYFAGVTLSKTRGFEASLNSDSYADLYRVDLDSGAAQKVDSASHKSRRWVIAPKGAIVAYSEYNQLNGEWRLHADKAAADPLLTVRAPFGRIDLAGAGRTPGTVLVDQDQPEEWSLADGTHVPLPVNGRIGRFLYDPSNG